MKGNFWISGMRVFAWLIFIMIIIGGIVAAVAIADQTPGAAALMVVASFIIAFLSVAGIMIFLDMARNVMYIREKVCLQKQDGDNKAQE